MCFSRNFLSLSNSSIFSNGESKFSLSRIVRINFSNQFDMSTKSCHQKLTLITRSLNSWIKLPACRIAVDIFLKICWTLLLFHFDFRWLVSLSISYKKKIKTIFPLSFVRFSSFSTLMQHWIRFLSDFLS